MKEQFSCQETKSLWGRRLLQSVPITLSLFVAIGSTAELMAANVVESAVSQQVAQFSGSVVDVNGEPLIGVNVLEKGTTNGTITDFDGKFTLNLSSPNAVLVFSYIGYVTQEISAKNQNELKVVLKEDAEKLDEVVVIGYGAVVRPMWLVRWPYWIIKASRTSPLRKFLMHCRAVCRVCR
jgi:hypothetical protein